MPLGIVPDEVFDKEIGPKKDVIDKPIVIDKEQSGRRNGDKEVPQELRKLLAEESIINGRKNGVKLAESFGISHDSVDAYKHGATSLATFNKPQQDLKSHLDKVKERITSKASRTLLGALDSITLDKLEKEKPRDAASIAKDMSVIIRNMEPEAGEKVHVGPNFVFYSPVMKKESDFEVI